MSREAKGRPRALFLAGNAALDFLNTRLKGNEETVDLFLRDEDVLSWLKSAGFQAPSAARSKPQDLLRAARLLRENIRSLVQTRKRGRRGNPLVLNRFLAAAPRHSRLLWTRANEPRIGIIRPRGSVGAILAPVAEAAAELLAKADFTSVKRCEDETCTLWFLDQTRSHRRRWCSMELCGNRHKVAAYRSRRRNQRSPNS